MIRDDPLTCSICKAVFEWPDEAAGEELTVATSAYWNLKRHVETEHAETMFVCPRQGESGMRGNDGPQAWWRDGDECSYCGSLKPETFFAHVEAGCEVGPTDKSYKAYIDIPNPKAGERVRIGSTSGPWPSPYAPDDITEAEKARGHYERIEYGPAPAKTMGKFYFQHLDDAGQDRFITLVNERKMKIGYPGHFYARPYFCTPVPKPANPG